jgi:outer membrane protein W
MRKIVLVLLAVLLTVSASAQTLDKPTRVSFFVSNLGFGWSEGNGSSFDAGVGVALERRFSPRWSAELALAREEHETQPYGFFNPATFELRTYPIDAVVRYSFLDVNTPWRPYVGAGARYVAAPDEPPNIEYENQLTPEVTAGVEFNGGASWSLYAGARQLIHDQTPVFDDSFKIAIGFGWRF